jgi:hypothetical protein
MRNDKPSFVWFKHFLADDVADTQVLSDNATLAYYRLMTSYFLLGGFDDFRAGEDRERTVRQLSRLGKKWTMSVRYELVPRIFTTDWHHPKWDVILAEIYETSAKRAASGKKGGRGNKSDVTPSDFPENENSYITDDGGWERT